MTPENEAKKDFLNRYKWGKVALAEIETEINACRMGALPGGINYDGMPHGSGDLSDLSDYAARLDDLLMQFRVKRTQLIDDLHEISAAIEAVEDPRSNILLRYRYIQLKDWGDIADAMGYVEDYVRRTLHSRALRDFEIPGQPKDVQQCSTDLC